MNNIEKQENCYKNKSTITQASINAADFSTNSAIIVSDAVVVG